MFYPNVKAMKTTVKFIKQNYIKINVILLLCVVYSCSQEDDPIPVNNGNQDEKVVLSNPTNGAGKFIIESDNIKKNDNGYSFEGTLTGGNNQEETFEIGHGDFEVVVGPGDEIENITGVGIPEFPKVGVFAEMLKNFDWTAVKSHFEYETGKIYKEKYNDEIPLDDNIKYLHIKAFDDSNDTRH